MSEEQNTEAKEKNGIEKAKDFINASLTETEIGIINKWNELTHIDEDIENPTRMQYKKIVIAAVIAIVLINF